MRGCFVNGTKMLWRRILGGAVVLTALGVAIGWAQDATPDRLKVSFRDPGRPGSIRIGVVSGSITVKGYNGQEVLVDAVVRRGGRESKTTAEAAGLRRIFNSATGLAVEEENNVMQINVRSHSQPVDVTVQTPMNTSLKLSSVNHGHITVENISGEIEVSNINGGVTLTGVSGSTVAHALNGPVVAVFLKLDPSKPMSFSSLNGKIDVTLPADLKADLNMRSGRGEIYSDFDVVLGGRNPKLEENASGRQGKYRVSTDSGVTGKINGGGQELTFKNMNGNIYIRKGK